MLNSKINGTYCISQAVPDSKKRTIWITSARIQKKHQDLDDNNVSPKTTPENALNASDNIIAEETQNVNISEEITTPALTDKCELHETTHTKTGEALWVISLNDKITSDEYKALNAAVKKVGGYYSRFAKTPDGKAIPGFIFKSEPDADVINTFNSFFGTETTDETAPAEAKSTVKEIDVSAVENAKVGDVIKLSDHEKQPSTEQALTKEAESATMVSEKSEDNIKNVKESTENVRPQSEVLDEQSEADGGGLHTGATGADVKTGTEKSVGAHRKNSGKGLSESVGNDGNRPDVRNDSEGIHRGNDEGNASSEAERVSSGRGGRGDLLRGGDSAVPGILSESVETSDSAEVIKTGNEALSEKRPSNKANFVITDDFATELDNTLPSTSDNLDAIKLLHIFNKLNIVKQAKLLVYASELADED